MSFVQLALWLGCDMEEEKICLACGWVGIESALLHPPQIGHAVCPKCESPDDLIDGEDLDDEQLMGVVL